MMGRTFLHMILCVSGLQAAHSQTTDRERDVLRKYSKGRQRGVEIGVYEGVTTCLIAEELARGGLLYSIDPFIKGRMGVCWSKLIATSMIWRSGLRERVQLVRKYSHEAAKVLVGQFDFIFVDGDHSLAGIKRDWGDWSNRVVPDGIIALHDSQPIDRNPEAQRLESVEYFEKWIRYDDRFEILEKVDSLTVLRRKH